MLLQLIQGKNMSASGISLKSVDTEVLNPEKRNSYTPVFLYGFPKRSTCPVTYLY